MQAKELTCEHKMKNTPDKNKASPAVSTRSIRGWGDMFDDMFDDMFELIKK